jgi:hypothetical protein
MTHVGRSCKHQEFMEMIIKKMLDLVQLFEILDYGREGLIGIVKLREIWLFRTDGGLVLMLMAILSKRVRRNAKC